LSTEHVLDAGSNSALPAARISQSFGAADAGKALPIHGITEMEAADGKKSNFAVPMMARGNRWCKTAGTMTPDPLDSDTVRVRWLPVEASDADHLSRWRGMLDAEELARADRYHFVSDRDTFTAAHALTRAMLSDATGLPTATWRYVTGEFGKPALVAGCAGGGLRFNISHTRGFVACAIARDEVGVDVEAFDRQTDFDIADVSLPRRRRSS
jgi:hypothetical protein